MKEGLGDKPLRRREFAGDRLAPPLPLRRAVPRGADADRVDRNDRTEGTDDEVRELRVAVEDAMGLEPLAHRTQLGPERREPCAIVLGDRLTDGVEQALALDPCEADLDRASTERRDPHAAARSRGGDPCGDQTARPAQLSLRLGDSEGELAEFPRGRGPTLDELIRPVRGPDQKHAPSALALERPPRARRHASRGL